LYAQAWAGLADSYVLLSTVAYGSVPTKDAMMMAKAAAKRALEINDTLCEAHTSLGVVKLRHEWDWQAAEGEFRRAIELNPDYAPAHFWYSNLLTVMGRVNESIAESEVTRELDPFSPPATINLGRAYYFARQYDRAVEHLTEMLKEKPDNSSAWYVLGFVYLQKGMSQEAIEIFEKLYLTKKSLAAAPLAYAYAKAGRRVEALKILAELDELSKQENIPPQERAIIYIGLDDKDQAFMWLEKAYEERFASIISLTSDPFFDSLRSDPRFAELARKINLTP
jgi:tetratricopeptide (TPR) repeat protein